EMVDVLDERLHLLRHFVSPAPLATLLVPRNSISLEGRTKHLDERSVAREEDRMRIFALVAALGGNIQPDERLPGSRNTGHKHDCLAPRLPCHLDHPFHSLGGRA